ncbi:hypothetical protein HYC85_020795 [Camellia sinensis]|uniref:CP12 domain-containing protein n=1 Tax=Camellia sinensis TaxID=4442 RepID=A0A7J7GQU4_CAMSI|nr:hypothetical protein HYC85_020795 [Camellia sinensis]
MASFITAALSGSSTVTRVASINLTMIQTQYPPPLFLLLGDLRSGDGFCSIRTGSKNNNNNNNNNNRMKGKAVKAIGGSGSGSGGGGVAKYKGTQMREKKLAEMIAKKVEEAKEVCEGDERSDECKVAWDEVEEVSQAKADLRLKLLEKQDPLEFFCQDNPETDECRIYDD